MADYIDKNILCQAYIHIEPENLSESQYSTYLEHLRVFAIARTRFFLYQEAEIQVEYKEGSLKAYITVFGTLTGLYAGIAQYPDFKAGAVAIYEDSKRLSEYLVSEGLFSAGAKHDQVLRVEARTGIVGSLRGVVADLDYIQRLNGTADQKTIADRMARVRADVQALTDNLHTEEDVKLVRVGLLEMSGGLPSAPSPGPGRKNSESVVAMYREEKAKLRNHLNALKDRNGLTHDQ